MMTAGRLPKALFLVIAMAATAVAAVLATPEKTLKRPWKCRFWATAP